MQDFPRKMENLSAEQLELLLKHIKQVKRERLEKTEATPSVVEGIARLVSPVSRTGRFPVSFAQERLWYFDQFETGSPLYNIPVAIWLRGALDITALEQALQEVIHRHTILRTTFLEQDGQPIQEIHPFLPARLPVTNLMDGTELERREKALAIANEEARQPFDLECGPLLRASLLRLSATEHLFLLTLHHIITDDWSMEIIQRELSTLYEAFITVQAPLLEQNVIQYADYAIWQRQTNQGDRFDAHLAYWRKLLAGAPPLLEMPADFPRPVRQTFEGNYQAFRVEPSLFQALKSLSAQTNVTQYMLFLAAFAVLLARYSGQKDLVIGTPVANRGQQELEKAVGFFVNVLPLRVSLLDNPTFFTLLTRIREMTLEAYTHQDLSFERLVEALQPPRDTGYNPVFQVLFAWQQDTLKGLILPGLELELLVTASRTAKFDLSLILVEDTQGLAGYFEYNTNLFRPETIKRLTLHYQTLLYNIAQNPRQLVSHIPFLTIEEQQQLFHWNMTQRPYPAENTIHGIFTAQATRTPGAAALVYQTDTLHYKQLDEQAEHLAHYLVQLGVGPDMLVGLCLERSMEMVISLLAILKAGGAYVPLDPHYPRERLAFIMQDSGAKLLLTDSHLAPLFTESAGIGAVRIVCLDALPANTEPMTRALPAVGSENLAYVMYTSGSTGAPKGVAVTHRNVVRLVKNNDYANFSPDQVFLQFAPLSFDASTFEIWGALLNGARLVVAPSGMLSIEELDRVIEENQVTTFWLTSALFNQVVDAQIPALQQVKQLLAGGDVLSVRHVEKMLGMFKHCHLINGYGPTESTTFTCCFPIDASLLRPGQTIPIGRPIANTQVYILDEFFQLVPPGIWGELYIGGDGLARGYLNQPTLTAQRFLPHPFSEEPGQRLYRSGDIARFLSDGTIEFWGRRDTQVKIRGYRIELGEIEAALVEHPLLKDALVINQTTADGDKRLIAYLVAVGQEKPVVSALRRYLQQKLPDYMIPAYFNVLESFPLGPGGKVDRQALAAFTIQTRPMAGSRYVPARTPLEEILADIWHSMLHLDRPISVYDNFFEAGGHSLLATQVISKVRMLLEIDVPVRTLFEVQNLAEFAIAAEACLQEQRHIERADDEKQALLLIASERRVSLVDDQANDVPLSFAQQRLWFFDQFKPGNPLYNIPVVFKLQGQLCIQALSKSINEIVRRHEALRTRFVAEGGQPRQRILPALTLPLPVIDLQGQSGEDQQAEIQQLVREEALKPFDLSRGPLLRIKLLCLARDEYIFVLNIHHIVTDAWSQGIFARELSLLYRFYRNDQDDGVDSAYPLEDLPLQYADFAVWQQRWLQGDRLEQQLAYWRPQLAGVPALIALPADHPRPAVQWHRGASLSFTLSETLLEALQQLSRRENATIFMTLLAAFQVLLYRYSGATDLVISAPIANRNRAIIEELIGCFVNTMPLRGDLTGDPSFRELLRRVRKTCLEAYSHQDLPFEQLVESLQLERETSYNPLLQIIFNMHHRQAEEMTLEGLAAASVQIENYTSKADLTLGLEEGSQEMNGTIEYNTDLFETTTIQRMIGHWQRLLESIAANPDQMLTQLDILPPQEYQTIVCEWNRTQQPFRRDVCLHQLFEEQAQKQPEAIALVYEEQSLTYANLNARANQLAHHLRWLGVRVGSYVAIYMDRAPEMVVAMLAILKAGGAYLPLEPAYPRARVEELLTALQVTGIITQSQLMRVVRAFQTKPALAYMVVLDEYTDALEEHSVLPSWRPGALSRYSKENPACTEDQNTPAYTIFTSGSTGTPKGVMVYHKSAVNIIKWMNKTYKAGSQDKLLFVTSICFDLSVHDVFSTLAAGACIQLAPARALHDADALCSLLYEQSVTIWNSAPAMLQQVVPMFAKKREELRYSHLRLVFLAGDWIPLALPPLLRESFPRLDKIVNFGGATETTVWSNYFEIDQIDPEWTAMPYGRPIANSTYYILDSHLNPCPIGVVGEMYIGDQCLAIGYNDPLLTSAKFIPDPFSSTPGARLYKTGDMGRFWVDGTIEFLGRIDTQVKIRGFRIELGEIEAALREYPFIRYCVVVPREYPPGSKNLVAYYVPRPGESTLAAEGLRSYLKQKLPDYMVPAVFVSVETFPLTNNGKLDYQRLPDPDWRDFHHVGSEAVASPVEQLLITIWCEILGLPTIDVYDNFFDLGGHSLLATQIIARIEETFQIDLPLQVLFDAPTVAELAQELAHYQDMEIIESSALRILALSNATD